MSNTEVNREFVRTHPEATKRRDVAVVAGNMQPNLLDHELKGDHHDDLLEEKERVAALVAQTPDLPVDVRDILADDDKVVVRAVWSGTQKETQTQVLIHGFVQFRIAEGKIAERWATVTLVAEVSEESKHC